MTREWESKLDRYVDSELSGDELTELQAHLPTCPSCAAGALSRLQLKRLTQTAGQRFRANPEFRLKIEERIGAKKRTRWLPAGAAAAALVLLLVSIGAWLQYSRGKEAVS